MVFSHVLLLHAVLSIWHNPRFSHYSFLNAYIRNNSKHMTWLVLFFCRKCGYSGGQSDETINTEVPYHNRYGGKGGSSACAPGARPPVWQILTVYFWKIDSITRINFIVINMQCLQYVFYSLLSLQKHRVCVQSSDLKNKIIPRRYRAPRFLNFWIRHCVAQ